MNRVLKYIILIVGIISMEVIIIFAAKNRYISDHGMVITFLGVLATFVVIGNYAQVAEIKQETKKSLEDMKHNVDKMYGEMYDPHDQLLLQKASEVGDERIREIVATYIREQDQRYSTLVNELFNRLTNREYIELIRTITTPNGRYSCNVLRNQARRSIRATVRLEGDFVVFRNMRGDIIDDVQMVNEHEYNRLEIADLIRLWQKISTPQQEEHVMQNIFGNQRN